MLFVQAQPDMQELCVVKLFKPGTAVHDLKQSSVGEIDWEAYAGVIPACSLCYHTCTSNTETKIESGVVNCTRKARNSKINREKAADCRARQHRIAGVHAKGQKSWKVLWETNSTGNNPVI